MLSSMSFEKIKRNDDAYANNGTINKILIF